MPSTRITLADVAERAGVSRTTASFVLSGRTDMRISSDAQIRVTDAAAALGYRPNLTARSLRTSVTRTIGLISDTIATTQYAGEVIHGALDAALAHDRLLFIAETAGDPDVEAGLLEEMLDRQVDGLVYAVMYTREAAVPTTLGGKPLVLLNVLNPDAGNPVVLPDEAAGGRAAARGLLDAGHRESIYAIGGRHLTAKTPDGTYAGRHRMDGIEEVLGAAGVRLAGVAECVWQPEFGYRTTLGLLEDGHRPKALICANDRVALGAYQAMAEFGMRLPEDVSVVSFDDSEMASWLRPALSSVALPHYRLGQTAVDLLVRGERTPGAHYIDMPLRTRASLRQVS